MESIGGEAAHLFSGQAEAVGLRELREDIERLLEQLRPADTQESDAISPLREQLDMLRTVVFESSLPTRALHGDVSLRNVLRPPRRLVWNDFKDTFRGPVPLGCSATPTVSGSTEQASAPRGDARGLRLGG